MHDLTSEQVPVTDLAPYHLNPRQGNVGVIAESLRHNGQYRPIVVNRGTKTGRPNEVLAGNHTLAAARAEGLGQLWAVFVDVDDEHAARIVAADNRTADLGTYDDRLLAELLSDLEDLAGTGYNNDDLDDLLEKLDPADEGDGDGPAGYGNPVVSYTIVFDDEGQQDDWFAFIRYLKQVYPDLDTVAERLMAHIAATAQTPASDGSDA